MKLTKSIKLGVAVGALVATAGLTLLTRGGAEANTVVSGPRDCDYGSVIYCGALSTQKLNEKYRENATGDLPAIYRSFGISGSDIQSLNKKTTVGVVHANGTVWANGKLIGVNAKTAGRTKTTNSVAIAGTKAYKRPPSDSFARPTTTIKIFIGYHGNQAAWGVITSCGNPLTWDKPDIDIQKTVAKKGSNSFGENRKVPAGSKVTFKLKVSETSGKVDAHDVKVSDTLPKPFTYVPNSIRINGKAAPHSSLQSIWLRTIPKGTSKTITFDAVAKLPSNKKCGTHKIVNTGKVTAMMIKPDSDTASAEAYKECAKPVYKCDDLSKHKVSRNKFKFTASATAKNGAKVKNYIFYPGDGSGKVTQKSNVFEHTYANPGNYNIRVIVSFTVDGKTVSDGGPECETHVKVEPKPEKPKYVCEHLTAKLVSGREYKFTASASASNGATIEGYEFDFGDGQTETTESNMINHTYAEDGNYMANVYVLVKVNGKVERVSSEDCETKVHVETEKPHYSCDLLTAKLVKGNTYKFTVDATAANGATIEGYVFDFGDGSEPAMSQDNTVEHTYEADGVYKAQAAVKVNVDGRTEVVTSEDCKAKVVISPEPVYLCEKLKVAHVNDNKYEFTAVAVAENGAVVKHYEFNFGDGTDVLTDSNKVSHTYKAAGTYKATVKVAFTVDGKTVVKTSEYCEKKITIGEEPYCEIPGKEHLSPDSPECVEVKGKSTELPATGAGSIAGVFAAITAAGTLGHRFVTLRRK